jgi:hypothetical protein
MRRLVYCFVFALLISQMSAGKADAGVEWCSEDPVFIVNGNIIDVTTSFPAKYIKNVKGPVVFELLVPENTILAAVVTVSGRVPLEGKVTKSLPKWQGLLGFPVVVRVTLNATASFETQTRVTGSGLFLTTNVKGKSNQVTTASYKLLLP